MHPFSVRGSIDFELVQHTRERIRRAGLAVNTQRNYASAWKIFGQWCSRAERPQLPTLPSCVEEFAAWSVSEGARFQTIALRLKAIAHYHREAGLKSPVDESVGQFMAKAKRELKEGPAGKAAVTRFHVEAIARRLTESPVQMRNRAMILLGFASGWRRSEVVSLTMADVQFVKEGMTLWLSSSKTDQTGVGRLVGIHKGKGVACPVRALKDWLKIRGQWAGALFVRFDPNLKITRNGLSKRGDVLRVVLKREIERLGEDPRRFGAHSLRSGMITEAAKHGASEAAIKQRTGHKCSQTLQRYIRPATLFDLNPLRAVL